MKLATTFLALARLLPSLAAAVLLTSLAPPPHASAQLDGNARARLKEAANAISELRLEDAARLLEGLERTVPDAPNRLFEAARLEFHRGNYAKAVELANRALADVPETDVTVRWRSFRDLMADTLEVTQDYREKSSADGRYVVRYPDGKDRYLADYAVEVLKAADEALVRALGMHMAGPIRLEIYPSSDTLARVSSLTSEQIETTGTVALSKWNRLMITSPRALLRGYPWADTITHEFVHMVLSQMTMDRAPVWLQEGTAKFLERSWRGNDAQLVLDPAARSLLYNARAENSLLTFEQMHPSIAMLPSQDDAALAFAQVATFMERYVERFGLSTLQAGLAAVREGDDAREALSRAAGTSFSNLERDWKDSVPAVKASDDLHRLKRRFLVGETPPDESDEVVEDEARRFMRLGDLLWDRGRTKAAAVEYRKAHGADREDPIVAARWARAALAAGDAASAVESLTPQAERYPGHAPTHAVLGRALLSVGDRERARRELLEAIWINPFDPDPHCGLAEAALDAAEAAREQKICGALR